MIKHCQYLNEYGRRVLHAILLLYLLLSIFPAIGADSTSYTVRSGDTLSGIAHRELGNAELWLELQSYNGLSDPSRLKPGSILLIPNKLFQQIPSYAEALFVRGEVLRYLGNELRGQVKRGDKLRAGETVETSSLGSVSLVFEDRSRLFISENSRVELKKLLFSNSTGQARTQVNVVNGRVESNVAEQKGINAQYEVITRALTLSVRGTQFVVQVAEDTNRTQSMVLEGEIVAATETGDSIQLEQGFGTMLTAGERLKRPVPLIPAPNLEIKNALVKLPHQLSWTPIPEASSYRIALYRGSSELTKILDEVTTSTSWDLAALPEGEYQFSVRGIDADNMEGLPTSQSINLIPHPLQVTSRDSGSGDNQADFQWSAAPNTETFHLQVSSDRVFGSVIHEAKQLPGGVFNLPDLPPGTYFMRIAAENTTYGKSPYSLPQVFNVPEN